jgi:DNA adenine methylase
MTDSHYPTAKPIVPWIGGKRRLAKHILPWFEPHTCYVEPFAGAAAMLFAKSPSKVEVINDINSDLVNLYRVVQHHLEELVRQFKWALTSRQVFAWVQSTPPETLTDIQRAARFLYLQMLCFGAKVEGRTFGVATTATQAINLLRLEENLSAAHLRLSQVVVEHMDWQACIRRYDRPHTLFYCDPPYWATEGYGVDFGMEQYHALADLMRNMAGKAIVSVNDVPEMREAFKGLHQQRLTIRYTVGLPASTRTEKGELLIRNW